MWSQEDVVRHLEAVEAAAEDVLADRQQIIDLSRKQNGMREARRALINSGDKSADSRTWIVSGNTFIKLPKENVKTLLHQDLEKYAAEINSLRDGLRVKVEKLNSLEQKPELKGFNLKALSQSERAAVHKILGN